MTSSVDDMRFTQLASACEVSQEDYNPYCCALAKSLSGGHDEIHSKVIEFMKKAASPGATACTSNFQPFEFQDKTTPEERENGQSLWPTGFWRRQESNGREGERILVEITVQRDRRTGGFLISSKSSRNCAVNSRSRHKQASHVATDGAANQAPVDPLEDARFHGYYNAVTKSLTKKEGFSRQSTEEEEADRLAALANESRVCRFCFDVTCGLDEFDPLVNPCNCSAPIHLQCLRRWQRVQLDSAPRPSRESTAARAATCEVCGALLIVDGERVKPPMRTAICRADALMPTPNDPEVIVNHELRPKKVALRRFPASVESPNVFSGSSVEGGQAVEVLEQDASGEFFRVRMLNDAGPDGMLHCPAGVEGWIQHVYLEWNEENLGSWVPPNSTPENPACCPPREFTRCTAQM